ncbi:hypothetical protein OIV83_006019 [Microbotryomycetes sp. JL201]|nr:hypothetical protein OIV83_006019 [Microbotryomycetes sp. JL201]
MGVVQYASMLSYLSSVKTLAHRPIIILVQPHISMSIFTKYHRLPPSESTCCAGIERMAKSWGFDKSGMTILSHSNGTIVHAWILRNLPHLAIRNAFADPAPRAPMEYIMRYFVVRELGVALAMQRHFSWSSNALWPDEVPNLGSPYQTAIFLSGDDRIVNVERVQRHLIANGVRNKANHGGLRVYKGKSHGLSLRCGDVVMLNDVLEWLSSEH